VARDSALIEAVEVQRRQSRQHRKAGLADEMVAGSAHQVSCQSGIGRLIEATKCSHRLPARQIAKDDLVLIDSLTLGVKVLLGVHEFFAFRPLRHDEAVLRRRDLAPSVFKQVKADKRRLRPIGLLH
jgi:hypothetical protein